MLKVAVIVLIIMSVYAGVYSLMGITVPKVLLGSTLKAAAEKTVDDAKSAGYLGALSHVQRSAGVYALAAVMSSLFVLFAGFRKAQKWAWWAFLVVGTIAWLGGLILTITIGDNMNIILHIIGIVIFLVGLLLPIKAFFAKAAEEA